jgi:hypothetical protein
MKSPFSNKIGSQRVNYVDPNDKKSISLKLRRIALTKLFDQVRYVENQDILKLDENKINDREVF